MDDLSLLIDFHKDAARQGPGSEAATHMAIVLAGLTGTEALDIADIGCGTGASALQLARALNANVTAVDFIPEFLAKLDQQAQAAGLSGQITALAASMDALPFAEQSLDVIWSEGAIYNLGFEEGLRLWRPFLKQGGILAVSELTWFTTTRPAALTQHWQAEYPQVAEASTKMAQLEQAGFAPIGYFPLPRECWLENYYRPMQDRLHAFLHRHHNSEAAQAIAEAERAEIELYERYGEFYGYGFYIARKVAS